MIRLGILAVSDELGTDRIKQALPPKHKVIAEREHSHLFITELLIEGPDMPECPYPAQRAEVVQLIFRRILIEGSMPTTYRVEAYWQHDPQCCWQVPDMATQSDDQLRIKVLRQETRRQTDLYADSLQETMKLIRAIQSTPR